jgi:hypothetical protein
MSLREAQRRRNLTAPRKIASSASGGFAMTEYFESFLKFFGVKFFLAKFPEEQKNQPAKRRAIKSCNFEI